MNDELTSAAGSSMTRGVLHVVPPLVERANTTSEPRLAVVATLYVAVAIYYYFRLVRSMFVGEETEKAPMSTSFGVSTRHSMG